MKLLLTLCCASLPIMLSTSAMAHHSFAKFDMAKEVTLSGVVVDWQWTNPHTWLQIMATDPDGTQVQWGLEGTSPNNMVRMGINKKLLKVGDKVTVVYHPSNDASAKEGSMVQVVEINGKPGPERSNE